VYVKIGTLGHSVHDEINEALKSWADRNYKKSVKYIHKVITTYMSEVVNSVHMLLVTDA
jgi:hypothetical protein